MPSFGWSSSREAKATVAADVDVGLKEPQVTVPSGTAEVDVTLPTAEIQAPTVEVTVETPAAAEGEKGRFKMPDVKMPSVKLLPKAEGSLPKGQAEVPEGELSLQGPDAEGGLEAAAGKVEGAGMKIHMPKVKVPILTADIEAPKVDLSPQSVSKPMAEGAIESLEEKEIKLKEEHEIKPEEVQTEEHQGWFKMPKFRIPSFARTSLKEKKGDAGIERIQTETSIPDNTFSLPHAVAEITIGKEGTPKLGDSVKSSDVSLPKMEGDITLSVERTDSRVNIPKTETYADVVKRGAEEQKMHTSKITVCSAELSKSHLSASETGTYSVSKTELGTAEMQFQSSKTSIGLESSTLDLMEASKRVTVETVDKSQGGPEVNVKIPKLKIPIFTFRPLPTEADVSVSKVPRDPKGSSTDIEVTTTTTAVDSSLSNAGHDFHWSYVEGQEVSEKVEPEHVAIERCAIYSTEILKESEVLSSEVKTATLGFSLLKAKLPESHSNLEVLAQQPSLMEDASMSKTKCADESFGAAAQRSGSAKLKLSDKPHSETEESRGEVSLPKLKTSAVEVKPFSKPEESHPDKSPEGITAGPLSKGKDAAEALEDEEKDITTEKEKADSKRSPGRFKFWLPTIGFSSSGDETSTDPKTEVKKSVPEDMKPADTSDNDSSKQTEKTGWFRFPKLGFTSPSKKAKTVDKEETGHKEERLSDEDSPSDKPDVFFDAQESLSPKEITEDKKVEIDEASSDVPVSRTIVTSSARTELILLEEEKDSQSNIPGDTTK
uniref:Protein AHNAK2 n=1 Tax=Calidris pygmaea TaxID=425635 RepID=A0A8C3J7A6_9CHAR